MPLTILGRSKKSVEHNLGTPKTFLIQKQTLSRKREKQHYLIIKEIEIQVKQATKRILISGYKKCFSRWYKLSCRGVFWRFFSKTIGVTAVTMTVREEFESIEMDLPRFLNRILDYLHEECRPM